LTLEVIEKGSPSARPLLFVHGGWHGAWCWDNFLNYFADAGYRAVALSLRRHDTGPIAKPLRWCSMANTLRVWRRHPLTAIRAFTGGTLLEFVNSAELARDYLFCACRLTTSDSES
jgi:hypothetical protein